MKTKNLDCTLRDGGYYTNWDFNQSVIDNYIKYTNDLEIEYLEIGYRNKTNYKEYKGQFYYTPNSTLKYFKKKSKHKIALMIDYKSLNTDELNDLLYDAKKLVSLIRVAVSPNNLNEIQTFVDQIKSMGFKVAINIMYLCQWNLKDINKSLSNIKNVDFIYLVDSYGSVYPDQLEKIILNLKNNQTHCFGFHSHDNIELAFANTLTAIKNEIDIVDSTILGMGRGAGNLKTELLFINIFGQSTNPNKYNIYDALANLVETFIPLKEKYKWGSDISYKFAGINSYPQKDIMFLKLSKNYKFSQIINHFDNKKYKKIHLEDISKRNNKNSFDTLIIGGGKTIIEHATAIKEFIQTNRNFNLIFSSSKYTGVIQSKEKNCYQIVIGSDISIVNSFVDNNIKYIFPLDVADKSHKNFYSLKIDNTNEVNHLHASIILTSIISNSKNVFLAGFDGFDQNDNFFNVFKANELILKSFEKKLNIKSITDTKYSIKVDSIYSKI